MTKESNDVSYQEHGIVTIYLPPLSSGDLFEIHAAIKTALGGLSGYKMDFRILGEKGENISNGVMGHKSGNPNEHTR